MKKEFKTGDRYQWIHQLASKDLFWDVVEFIDKENVVVLSGLQEGITKSSYVVVEFIENYRYLGNFSKSSNYINLYDKLCASI